MDEFLADLDLIARAQKDGDKNEDQLLQETAWAANVERFKRDWPNLPAPPFLIGISAKFGMGKSSIICYLINKWLQYSLFKEIIYFSESGQVDDKMEIFCPPTNEDFSYSARNLDMQLGKVFESRGLPNPYSGGNAKKKKETVTKMAAAMAKKSLNPVAPTTANFRRRSNLGTDAMNGLSKSQINAAMKRVRPRVTNTERFAEDLSMMTEKERIAFAKSIISNEILLVFDDSSGQPILKRDSRWWPFMTMLRHLKASAMMAYHQFKQLGTTLRANMSVNVTFPTDNPKEAEAIAEESGMDRKTFENLLRSVSRMGKGNYLVRYTDSRVNDRLLNFKAVLSPAMINNIVSAEKGLGGQGDSQTGIAAPEGADKERAIGGTPILMSALDAVPMDKTKIKTPITAIRVGDLKLTPAQQKIFPKAVAMIQRVEEIVLPTIPDPAAMAAKLTLRPKPMSGRKRSAGAAGLPSVGSGPSAKRPSSAQNREAATGTLHPDSVVAGLLGRLAKRKTAAVRSATVSAVGTRLNAAVNAGDAEGALALAARLNSARRGSVNALRVISASTPGLNAARVISQSARRASSNNAIRIGGRPTFKPAPFTRRSPGGRRAGRARGTKRLRSFLVSPGGGGLQGAQAAGLGVRIGQLASDLAAAREALTKLSNKPPPVAEGQPKARPPGQGGPNRGSKPAGKQENVKRPPTTRSFGVNTTGVSTETGGTQTEPEAVDTGTQMDFDMGTQTDTSLMDQPTALPRRSTVSTGVQTPDAMRPMPPPRGPFNALPPGSANRALEDVPNNAMIAYHTRARGNDLVDDDDDGFASAEEGRGGGGFGQAVGNAARTAGALTGNFVAGTLATAGTIAGAVAGGVARGTARGVANGAAALGRQLMGGNAEAEGFVEDAPRIGPGGPRIEVMDDDAEFFDAGAPQLQLEWYQQDGQPDQQINDNVNVVQRPRRRRRRDDEIAAEQAGEFRARRGRGSAEGPRNTRAVRRQRQL